MKIAYIAAGAGGMYCGSCIHDNALATALQRRGEDALLMQIYTPLRTDEPSAASGRVFYGAINIFLEQKLPWFRHLPGFLHRWLDRPGLLKRIPMSSSMTDASDLGALTLSMLQGEEGRQARELKELVDWLRDSFQPDIVHLSNSMLLGLAPSLRRDLGVPLVCSLQGEDIFLEELEPSYRRRVLAALRDLAGSVDHFVATSRYYAEFMTDYLGLSADRISVARIGISLDGHRRPGEVLTVNTEGPLTLGFLARICPEKGLHDLCAAFRLLSDRMGQGRVRLSVAGYLGGRDRTYLAELTREVDGWGLSEYFDVVGEVDRDEKLRFLQSLDILSVPTTYREPKGLFVLEAMANGVPVVQPNHGAFPELIAGTGGGTLVEAGSVQALADGIFDLWQDAPRRQELGRAGQEAVHRRYNADVMAEETMAIYERVVGSGITRTESSEIQPSLELPDADSSV